MRGFVLGVVGHFGWHWGILVLGRSQLYERKSPASAGEEEQAQRLSVVISGGSILRMLGMMRIMSYVMKEK